jgi:hypothetical protein
MTTQEVKEATPRKGVMIAGTFTPKMSTDWAFYQLGVAQTIIEALVDEGSYKTRKANKVNMKKRAIKFLEEIRSES